MTKELIICIIIVGIILLGNFFTQNYTRVSVEETTTNLDELRDEITKEEET